MSMYYNNRRRFFNVEFRTSSTDKNWRNAGSFNDDSRKVFDDISETHSPSVNYGNPLADAVMEGNWQRVEILLRFGADKNVSDTNGNGLYHIAAERGHTHIVNGLFQYASSQVNKLNARGESPLHVAARCEQSACFGKLISFSQTDPNIQDENGNAALHLLAVMEDSVKKTAMLNRILSSRKVNYHLQNHAGFTPIQLAVVNGRERTVEAMLTTRPSLVNSRNKQGMLPIHLAACFARHKVLSIILQYVSDTTVITKAGRTPLHFAIERWANEIQQDMARMACIQLLIDARVRINIQDCTGETAGHLIMSQLQTTDPQFDSIAASLLATRRTNIRLEEIASRCKPNWQLATACFLAINGANLSLKNRVGKSMLELTDNPKIRNLLAQYSNSRLRACLLMSSSQTRTFDSKNVTICTLNCKDNPADVEFLPCKHRVVCSSCVESAPFKRCPLCYHEIEKVMTSTERL